MQRQITVEQIVQTGVDGLKATIYLRMPGAVVAYHADTQTADVQPMVNDVRLDLEMGTPVFEPWSVIYNVPVCWPRFGGFTIAGFLEENDQVVLEAFDLDPTPWRAQGRSKNPVNPYDLRRLGGNYWSANPTDLTGPMQDASAAGSALVIGVDGDSAQIRISKGSIQFGSSGGDAVALANKVKGELTKIATAFTSFIPGTGGASFGDPYVQAGDVGSTLLKAQ